MPGIGVRGGLLAVAAIAVAGAGLARAGEGEPAKDPAGLFAPIDLTKWYNAEYLSGTQKDEARLLFMRQLPADDLAEIGRRCDLLQPDFPRLEDNVWLICATAWAALKAPR